MNADEFIDYYNSKHTIKEFTEKFNELNISERKLVLDSFSETRREKFIKDIRKQAVNDFWTHEQKLIRIIQ